ncbi:hypothetical protein CDAR_546071 [Caerostris darwini]|uniref:Uncharacterized protein n=1 Tax=Caerostris darwini TaxID=1538125 RepID=A0AAV4X7J2_9ARAC|nr:hypothetical protein CDAR_546071 [Caerostris darwini]
MMYMIGECRYRDPQNSRGVLSRDRGGQAVGPSCPIHRCGMVSSKESRTSELQCEYTILLTILHLAANEVAVEKQTV